jgi:hypothetical protein
MIAERWMFSFDTVGDGSNYVRTIEFTGPGSAAIYSKVVVFVQNRERQGWKLLAKRCVGKRNLT